MRPPEAGTIAGPERATREDIAALNRLFSEAFTDRYHRDGMAGVRVPLLNPEIWAYALEDAGDGAMLWRDALGVPAAFNIVHRSGTEGWMGPLAVRTGLQGSGIGRRIVSAGIRWLRESGATAIGLETMPRTVDNIGFYAGLGFRPGHLTITLSRPIEGQAEPAPGLTVLGGAGERAASLAARCAGLTDRLAPGVDYSREIALTDRLGLGDTTILEVEDRVAGYALWHSAPLSVGRGASEVRILKLVAEDVGVLCRLVDGVCGHEAPHRADRVVVRCQTAWPEAWRALLDAGFRVQWTDLRMLLDGSPEQSPGGIVFSNWEI